MCSLNTRTGLPVGVFYQTGQGYRGRRYASNYSCGPVNNKQTNSCPSAKALIESLAVGPILSIGEVPFQSGRASSQYDLVTSSNSTPCSQERHSPLLRGQTDELLQGTTKSKAFSLKKGETLSLLLAARCCKMQWNQKS